MTATEHIGSSERWKIKNKSKRFASAHLESEGETGNAKSFLFQFHRNWQFVHSLQSLLHLCDVNWRNWTLFYWPFDWYWLMAMTTDEWLKTQHTKRICICTNCCLLCAPRKTLKWNIKIICHSHDARHRNYNYMQLLLYCSRSKKKMSVSVCVCDEQSSACGRARSMTIVIANLFIGRLQRRCQVCFCIHLFLFFK